MTKHSFSLLASSTIESVFNQISAYKSLEDFDIDQIDNVLKVDFDNGNKMILNVQAAAKQLWLASPEGPAHFSYDEASGQWRSDKTDATLETVISRVLSIASGDDIRITLGD